MLCESWGALPFDGGLLEQPLGLLLLGATLRDYARAFAMYQRDPKNAPASVRDLVLMTARASAEMRLRS